MQAGILRQMIEVQKPKPTAEAGAHGHKDLTDSANWVSHCQRRAEVTCTGVREQVSGDRIIAVASYTVRMRFDGETSAITTRMRVRWKEKTLNVEAAFDPDGLRREWRLDCTEQT